MTIFLNILKVFLLFTIFYSLFFYEYEKIFKEEESIEILKILGLINNTVKITEYIIMPEENIRLKFKLKKNSSNTK